MKRFSLQCRRCGHVASFRPQAICGSCGSPGLEVRYEPDGTLADSWRNGSPEPSLWRYRDRLPIADDRHAVTLGEGGTPLIAAERLGRQLGLGRLYAKDERQNPTGSFKDRQGSLALSMLREHGVQEVVVASTGNVALAYAAYGARAGISVHAFLPRSVPGEKLREVLLYGARTTIVEGTYDATKDQAARFARAHGLFLDQGFGAVPAVEGMKTLAFEIAEQLGWRAPDWYIQAVSGGMGPVGVARGFAELQALGLVDKVPALGLVQVSGCAPMAEAFHGRLRQPRPVLEPATAVLPLATGTPGPAYELLVDLLSSAGGTFTTASDAEAWEAMRLVARTEGISVEPATAVAFAGLVKLVESGVIGPDECVVVNVSGHTYSVESHVVGAHPAPVREAVSDP